MPRLLMSDNGVFSFQGKLERAAASSMRSVEPSGIGKFSQRTTRTATPPSVGNGTATHKPPPASRAFLALPSCGPPIRAWLAASGEGTRRLPLSASPASTALSAPLTPDHRDLGEAPVVRAVVALLDLEQDLVRPRSPRRRVRRAKAKPSGDRDRTRKGFKHLADRLEDPSERSEVAKQTVALDSASSVASVEPDQV